MSHGQETWNPARGRLSTTELFLEEDDQSWQEDGGISHHSEDGRSYSVVEWQEPRKESGENIVSPEKTH